jgi:hypothetical protein
MRFRFQQEDNATPLQKTQRSWVIRQLEFGHFSGLRQNSYAP